MKVLLFFIIFTLLSGCREPECTNELLENCLSDYMSCLSGSLDAGIITVSCLIELCNCLEMYNCEDTREYQVWCEQPYT